ncbi:hypothetical protein CP967_33535 [Streptomyces nitrosporeus]|uniref:Secreted protein/lipoprotein n=1 Tax=Streptomyces nitrosporeus TaxID=28894 RepID=A0A5J6FLP3_9ACTN|nr:hypothetical protein [Streptomyces nitrosporeus]QEU76244.1 hypothetical protein CP967_33535 [Streptomyces nitrosporeus]GGZ21832.1 hypothetical protein GCM10010327_61020 [Streptomyces nitrosporeus]
MTTVRQKHTRRGALSVCAAVVLAVTAGGCGNGGDDAKPSAAVRTAPPAVEPGTPPTASRSPADPDPDSEAETEVLRVYSAMSAERMKAYRTASARGTDLAEYAAPGVLSAFSAELARMRKDRTVIRGDLGHRPRVTRLDTGAPLPTARVEDCVDQSERRVLDTLTGWPMPLPTDQPSRYRVEATVERGDSGRWKVTGYDPDLSQPC